MDSRPFRPTLPERSPGVTVRSRRRLPAAEETHAEASYYIRQMAARTPIVVVLTDGEELRGVIEWYDRGSIKLNRVGKPNLLLLKHAIKYLYKDPQASPARR